MSNEKWAATSCHLDYSTVYFHGTEIVEGGVEKYLRDSLEVGEWLGNEGETVEEAVENIIGRAICAFDTNLKDGQATIEMDGNTYFFQLLEEPEPFGKGTELHQLYEDGEELGLLRTESETYCEEFVKTTYKALLNDPARWNSDDADAWFWDELEARLLVRDIKSERVFTV